MPQYSKFLPLEEFISTNPLTPESLTLTLETKLNMIEYKPLLVSNGGVKRAAREKYDIVLEETLSHKKREKVLLHELIHIHYSDVTPLIESEEDYNQCGRILKKETCRFTIKYPGCLRRLVNLLLP
ncbi:MAG: hypothetical protein AABW65_03325 [Nanoarchaeota archaeon]